MRNPESKRLDPRFATLRSSFPPSVARLPAFVAVYYGGVGTAEDGLLRSTSREDDKQPISFCRYGLGDCSSVIGRP